MIEIPISFLQPGQITDQQYFSVDGSVLIPRRTLITSQDLSAFKKKGITCVYVNGSSEDEELNKLIDIEFDDNLPPIEKTESNVPYNPRFNSKSGKDGLIELQKNPKCAELDSCISEGTVNGLPSGVALKDSVALSPVEKRTVQYKSSFLSDYNEALKKTDFILHNIAAGKETPMESIRSIASTITKAFITDRSFLLNLSNVKPADGDYLFNHVLNVCIVSVNIATAYGYSETQVVEIAMGALLHDVGMLLIPEEIRFKDSRPGEDEWYEIQKHPLIGIYLLEKIHNLPEAVMLVAYQTHERENGKGYPKQRSSRLIHNYAKIVAIADIYEALSSPRSYRDAYLPYKAMEALIKMTRQGLISSQFVKALLEYTSLFPIGSIVELSNKCIGKVVQSNGMSFAKPSICILTNTNGELLPENERYILNLCENTGIQVVKTHKSSQLNQNIMIGF